MNCSETSKTAFTLIELLIVVGLLGALACIAMPRLAVDRQKSMSESIAPYEMMQIKHAFDAFVTDCMPTTNQLSAFTNLAVLVKRGEFDEYDYARSKGWRGPYLNSEIGEPGVFLDPFQNAYVITNNAGNGTLELVFNGPDNDSQTNVLYYFP